MNNEIVIRVGSFLTVFIFIALWEIVARRRSLTTSKKARWFSNLSIIFINTLLVRLIFPFLAVNMAIHFLKTGRFSGSPVDSTP